VEVETVQVHRMRAIRGIDRCASARAVPALLRAAP
jgi:hypothetical protein